MSGSTGLKSFILRWLVFTIVMGCWSALAWPYSHSFLLTAFGDAAANLKAQELVDSGYIPTLDFGYNYGLLPLIAGKIWFHLIPGPAGLLVANSLFILAETAALAWLSLGLGVKLSGLAAICVLSGFAIFPLDTSPVTYGAERVLLMLALAACASDRRAFALSLVTLALFIKPAMALIFGLIIVLLLLAAALKGGGSRKVWQFTRSLMPAAGVFLCCSIVLMFSFGSKPLLNSLLPFGAAAHYRALGYGWLSSGKDFWHPQGVSWRYYVGTPAGPFLVGTVLLAIGFAVMLLEGIRGTLEARRVEFVGICFVFQLAFITILYGPVGSWRFYSYGLVLGLVACATSLNNVSRSRIGKFFVVMCVLVAALGYYSGVAGSVRSWSQLRPRDETYGMWSTQEVADEWVAACRTSAGAPTLVLTQNSIVDRYEPSIKTPRLWYLAPAIPNNSDLTRLAADVTRCHSIIAVDRGSTSSFPATIEVTGCQFTLIRKGQSIAVYVRPSNDASHGPSHEIRRLTWLNFN